MTPIVSALVPAGVQAAVGCLVLENLSAKHGQCKPEKLSKFLSARSCQGVEGTPEQRVTSNHHLHSVPPRLQVISLQQAGEEALTCFHLSWDQQARGQLR